MRRNKIAIYEEKGSALILVVICIMLVLVLGASVLTMSLNNIKMSSKFKNNSKEYYGLDKLSETIMYNIDEELKDAENEAIDYMEAEKYSNPNATDLNDTGNQSFFYNNWKNKVHDPSMINIINRDNRRELVLDSDVYNKNLKQYFQQIFNRVYFNLATKKLNTIMNKVVSSIGNDVEGLTYTITLIRNPKKNFVTVDYYSRWEDFEPNDDDVILNIVVTNKSGKKISSKVNICAPQYEALEKKKYNTIKRNSIYEKAITYSGEILDGIKFDDSQKLDLSEMNGRVEKTALLNDKKQILPDTQTGIMYLKSTNNIPNVITICDQNRKGIIYSEGDLIIQGDGNFLGVIMVEGNVKIQGTVTIQYDESIIKEKLNDHSKAIDFFRPGASGTKLDTKLGEDTNVRARKTADKRRYKVSEWKVE